jgi:hypothetical protein
MAQETLVTQAFSDAMAAAGAELLRRLDRAGLLVRAALWLYMPDEGRWRFVLATPFVKADGPRKVYKKIQAVLAKLPEDQPRVDLQSITAIDSSEPFVQALRSAISTGGGISGLRISRSVFNGYPIEDAFIYRLA